MKHNIVKVKDLMYKGCEIHWGCTRCGEIYPNHCYNRQQMEERECKPAKIEYWKNKENRTW